MVASRGAWEEIDIKLELAIWGVWGKGKSRRVSGGNRKG